MLNADFCFYVFLYHVFNARWNEYLLVEKRKKKICCWVNCYNFWKYGYYHDKWRWFWFIYLHFSINENKTWFSFETASKSNATRVIILQNVAKHFTSYLVVVIWCQVILILLEALNRMLDNNAVCFIVPICWPSSQRSVP